MVKAKKTKKIKKIFNFLKKKYIYILKLYKFLVFLKKKGKKVLALFTNAYRKIKKDSVLIYKKIIIHLLFEILKFYFLKIWYTCHVINDIYKCRLWNLFIDKLINFTLAGNSFFGQPIFLGVFVCVYIYFLSSKNWQKKYLHELFNKNFNFYLIPWIHRLKYSTVF